MTQYNSLNVKLSNSQLKLKSAKKMPLKYLENFPQIRLVILVMKIIFHINYY